MYEKTGGVNWGTTRRCQVEQTKSKRCSKATSGSDEAIVSYDLAGQHNRPGSQGPLDERVCGDGTPYIVAMLVLKDHNGLLQPHLCHV